MTYIERMELELNELNEKYEKGMVFLNEELLGHKNYLDKRDAALLYAQLLAMRQYRDILTERLSTAKIKVTM
ncbi:MAG: crAss001_48 related protein [Fusobacteriaceae bacterium]